MYVPIQSTCACHGRVACCGVRATTPSSGHHGRTHAPMHPCIHASMRREGGLANLMQSGTATSPFRLSSLASSWILRAEERTERALDCHSPIRPHLSSHTMSEIRSTTDFISSTVSQGSEWIMPRLVVGRDYYCTGAATPGMLKHHCPAHQAIGQFGFVAPPKSLFSHPPPPHIQLHSCGCWKPFGVFYVSVKPPGDSSVWFSVYLGSM